MEDQENFKNFQDLSVTDKDINILLLGETGVGKSTFINSIVNYLQYDEFEVAEKSKVQCVISAKFTVTDENFEEKIIEIGKDSNENNTIYESATLQTRSYVFPNLRDGTGRIRFIDTPGIGDVSGIDRDNENMENILSYISNLENLHAICFLLKPNNARLTVMFHYCIKQLLSRLEKSASKNIIFLFTNTRSTFYKPGDTTTSLRKILNDIKEKPPYTEIKFTKDNVFCLDNESFRYLVAIKNGIQLGNKNSFVESWTHSVKECSRMIDFITGKGNSDIIIIPHKVKDTMSVNEARKVILHLSQPLADIADLVSENITALEGHNKSLQTDNVSIAQLKENLYVPVVNIRCTELLKPTTVCTAYKCCELYMVHNIKKYHYKKRCHDPCYLKSVPKEQIGSPELVHCSAMVNRKCKKCGCDFSTHMHVYYISETFEDRIDNEGVRAQIKDRETALKETRKLIDKIVAMKLGYEKEKDTIIKTMAKFAHFLQSNAIAPYNDSYKAYVEYLIDREKSEGTNYDPAVLRHYNDLLKRYEEEKRILDVALSSQSETDRTVTTDFVFDSVKNLYMLPHTGKKIQELYTRQLQSQTREHKNTEIVMPWHVPQDENSFQNKNIAKGKSPRKKKKAKNQRNVSNNYNQSKIDMQNVVHNEQTSYNLDYQASPSSPRYSSQMFHPLHLPNPQNYPHLDQQNELFNFVANQASFPNQGGGYDNCLRQSSYSQGNDSVPERNKQFFFHNDLNKSGAKNNNASSSTEQSNFEEWYKTIIGGNSNDFTEQIRYDCNILPGQNDVFKHGNIHSKSTRDLNQFSSTESEDDTDDDESFKNFMKKNNLDYLVKNSARTTASSKGKSGINLDSASKDSYSGTIAKNMDVNNSTKPLPDKNKSFLSNLFGMR